MSKAWRGLIPGLVIGFGIVAATLVAKRTADSSFWVLAAPILLAATILIADAVAASRRRPSAGAWILAATCLIDCLILGAKGRRVAEAIPLLGTVAWLVLLLPGSRSPVCSSPRS